MMDFRAVVTISTLLLLTSESDQTTLGPDVRGTSFPTQTNSTSRDCFCPCATPAAPPDPTVVTSSSAAPAVGILTISWTRECEGDVELILHPASSSSPRNSVCHDKTNVETNFHGLLKNVCQNKRGCKGTPNWDKGRHKKNAYYIKESGAEKGTKCETLRVQCTVEVFKDVQGQLQAYKVVTALLCCVLLVLLLIRFTRPTVKALQKRLSDRRQNRWIGPTQSHSVSYHRGKTAVKNNEGEKRLSYPALQRLAVSDSREPSSNRNSDYNF